MTTDELLARAERRILSDQGLVIANGELYEESGSWDGFYDERADREWTDRVDALVHDQDDDVRLSFVIASH